MSIRTENEVENAVASAPIEALARPSRQAKVKPRTNISNGRESVESFVFVFLFFLVLGVQAEGFVIPTGSMAPTLMGRHKEVTCPECGEVYSVNADREVSGGLPIDYGTCPNCRFMAPIADQPNFQGDRIYVMKTPVEIPFLPSLGKAVLSRWDTAVFKLPEEPEVRYIKRLVGMSGEVLRILRGDIWIRPLESNEEFRRAPRPLRHQEAMQQIVYNDAHRARSLKGDRRWARWSGDPWSESPTEPGTYAASAEGKDWAELRYANIVPDPAQWAAVIDGSPLPHPPRPTLIADFCAYNTDLSEDLREHPAARIRAWQQPHWVGDLTVRFQVETRERKGKLRVELIKAGVVNRAEIDLETGQAMLFHNGQPVSTAKQTGLGPGTHALMFANVDDRLTLRVDDRLSFGEGVNLEIPPGEPIAPTEADLAPVAVAIQGTSAAVSGLVLYRDIYYTLSPGDSDYKTLDRDNPLPTDPVAFFDWLAEPKNLARLDQLRSAEFPIERGRYMMLGDNSTASRDGRGWQRTDQIPPGGSDEEGWDRSGRETWEVPEALLIGKAFCVYWPHMKPVWPAIAVSKNVRLPAIPNFWEIRWIR
jgi:signal peptidase I